MKQIRTVLIGAGYRGNRLRELMAATGCFRLTAVFDPALPDGAAADGVAGYSRGEDDYRRMLREQQPELAVIASPWHFHIPQALHCVEAGCHIALEIRGGRVAGEYDDLLRRASERGCRIYPLENTVFMRENMALFEMVRHGLFGEIIALRGGYRHDIRPLLVDENGRLGNPNMPEGIWRSHFYTTENGDLYPTHGLAPLCLAAGIGRNDRFVRLTSFASKARGLQDYIRRHGGDASLRVTQGDVVVTQLETEQGVLLTLTHDTTLPRPRSLDFELQGTRGLWRGEFRKIYIDGQSPSETWEDDAAYIAAYEHPFWRQWGEAALAADRHHQGMDYVMLRALAADCRGEAGYPIRPEDLALWTSVSPLSKQSIATGQPVDCR